MKYLKRYTMIGIIFVLTMGIFILSIVIAFRLSYKLTLSRRLEPYTFLLCCLVLALFICFILFTYYPPKTRIFEDPAVSQTTALSIYFAH